MPAQERSIPIDGRALWRRSTSAPAPRGNGKEYVAPGVRDPRAEAHIPQWDESRLGSGARRGGAAIARGGCCRVPIPAFIGSATGSRRCSGGSPASAGSSALAVVIAVLAVIFAGCFGGLWWRLGAGPINLDMATPWLAAAIEDNIGHGNTVEVGGTQIERAGRIRIAVRIRDIVVRDRDHAIVASAPKAEVKLSGTALLMGRLRAESLNLVDAELAVRITPDGQVTVSAGDTAKPLATGVASKRDAGMRADIPAADAAAAPAASPSARRSGAADADAHERIAGRPRLARQPQPDRPRRPEPQRDRPEERQSRSSTISSAATNGRFENISLSLRRPSGGGVALSLGEEGAHPWSLRVVVGPPANGVRSVDLRADKVPAANILLAMRVKDLTYSADLPLSGELKGELGRDGLPTYFRGKITAGAGNIIDSDTPDYPMAIDSAEMNVEWDSGRRVLVAPFKIVSGANRITLLAHLEPPNGNITDWQAGP